MEVQTADSKARRRAWLGILGVCVAIVAVTAWAYRPALDADFVMDDAQSILDNPALYWTSLSWENVRGVLESSRLSRRAVANISFSLNFLAGGVNPFGFHLVNVLVHLCMGAALAIFLRLYLKSTAEHGQKGYGVAAVALPVAWFLLHPLNTQAVTYVVQRMTSLAALFAVLCMAAYLAGRSAKAGRTKAGWYVAATLLWMLGLYTKENVALVPVVLLTFEWCFHRDQWRERWHGLWNRGPRTRAVVLAAAVSIVCLVGFGLYTYIGSNPFRLLEPWRGRNFNGLERMLTQTRVHWLYLSQVVWPLPGRLNLDHDFSVSRGLLQPPTTLVSMLGLAALLGLAVYLAIKRPRLGFPLLAYFEFHAIESGPVSLELVFEHRMYLPMAMLALALGTVLHDLRSRWHKPVLVVAALYVVLLATATRVRSETWSDPVRLAEDVVSKSPLKRRAQADLGGAYFRAGRYEEAEAALLRAIEMEPWFAKTYHTLGSVYLEMGQPDKALEAFEKVLQMNPGATRVRYAIGAALEAQGRTVEAFDHYMQLGSQFAMEGKPFQAMEPLRRAVRIDPESSIARNALGNVYLMAEMEEEALEQYRKAVELDSTNAQAVYNLATLLDREGMRAEALDNYRLFVEVAPPGFADYVRQAEERVRQIEADVP